MTTAEITIAILVSLSVGFIAGLVAMVHHRPRCRCGLLLPVTCPYGYGCRESVRPWIAAQAEQMAADARERGERP